MMTTNSQTSAVDQLHALVERYGFRYVLIKGGAKRPSTKAWQEGVTRAQAEKWLGQGNNLGLAVPDGVVVLDIDPRNGGSASFNQMVTDLGIRGHWETYIAKTGGGGRHILLGVPAGFKAYGQAPGYPGVDIKQHGGYIVAPPSVHPNGEPYAWERIPEDLTVMPAHPRLLQMIEKPDHVDQAYDFEPIEDMAFFQEILDALDPEDFSDYQAWIEISMALHALTGGSEEAADYWVEWCQRDPRYAEDQGQFAHWQSFASGGVTAATVLKFLNKADRHLADELSRKIDYAGVTAATEFEPVPQEIIDALPDAPVRQEPDEADHDGDRRTKRAFWRRLDQLPGGLPTYRWLFKNLLPRNTYGVITGPTGVGKSQVALDFALHLAGGHDWQSHRCAGAGRVGYIDIEQGVDGQQLRRAAWDEFKKLPYPHANVYVSGISPQLARFEDSAAFDAMVAGIKQAELDLVIFDTLSATMAGNVSDGDDVMALLRAKQQILDETDAAVLFVAHMGKDRTRGNKGFTEITDQADLVFEIHKNDKGGQPWLVPVKNRWARADGETGWRMTSEQVVLGQDEDGDDITSVVVTFSEFMAVDLTQAPDATVQQEMAIIMAAVEDTPGITINALVKSSGLRKQDVIDYVNIAITQGSLEERSGPRNSRQLFVGTAKTTVDDLL